MTSIAPALHDAYGEAVANEGLSSAAVRLDAGQKTFSSARSAYQVEVDPTAVNAAQTPFAAVLGCADARVPVEFVFGQAANDLFVVRVAGAVPGAECLGSLHYAVANLPTVEVVAVVGHSQCGAVTAAVDALLHPGTYLTLAQNPSLRAIVDALLAGVRIADVALRGVHGDAVVSASNYRELLVEAAIVANTAVTASVLANALPRPVVFGVFELDRGSVGHYDGTGWSPHLAPAVVHDAGLTKLMDHTASAQIPA